MRRREFITLLGGAATWPIAARAQQMRRVGILMARAESDPLGQERTQVFRAKFQELGWRDGENVRIDYRWAAGVAERFKTAAAELVALKPNVIIGDATPSVAALMAETRSIPIVFVAVTDPIGPGFVQSIARPGGNVTGFTNIESSLGGKWLGLLKEVAPSVTRVAVVYNPTTLPSASTFLGPISATAQSLGIAVSTIFVRDVAELERAITAFAREPGGGLITPPDSFLGVHRDRLGALIVQHRLPSISSSDPIVRAGGLMSYGANGLEPYRGAATYVDRILKGAKPSELPVQAPTKFKLVFNLKSAKALGLAIPESFLLRADEVIE